jgi:phosphopentomutase
MMHKIQVSINRFPIGLKSDNIPTMKRIILIVLDSVGVGGLPDARAYNDEGANTLGNLYRARGHLGVPNLAKLGLGKLVDIGGIAAPAIGCYGKMAERSASKDTTSGHWEMAGIVVERPFPTYPAGFPQSLITEFETLIKTRILGNCPASGTEIIKKLGREHLSTGYPIVYTSADSVFQIAAHEQIVPLETLYEYSRIARKLLTGAHAVGRVIARPFKSSDQGFERNNDGRKDYSLPPPEPTLLDHLKDRGRFVAGVGKIGDIFSHRGLTEEIHTHGNPDGLDKTIATMHKYHHQSGLIFTNLVDFDMVYGHRRNVEGYAAALEAFDRRLPQLIDAMADDDILILTADHGCDPTYAIHTDHTREYVPLLVGGKTVKNNIDLGTRETFADCGQTIADLLDAKPLRHGHSFKKDIVDERL